jgi:hypothetical protein
MWLTLTPISAKMSSRLWNHHFFFGASDRTHGCISSRYSFPKQRVLLAQPPLSSWSFRLREVFALYADNCLPCCTTGIHISPHSAIRTSCTGLSPLPLPPAPPVRTFSIFLTTSMLSLSATCPNMTCLPSKCGVAAVVMKN